MRTRLVLFILATLLLTSLRTAFAHANLLRSDPPANASLDSAPAEIRLWFSEPLEVEFSRIILRDREGEVVSTPPARVDASDRQQLVMEPGALDDGLYTVTWRVLSTDGHSTEGSFAFGVGVPVTVQSAVPQIDETVPPDSAVIRAFNLFSQSLAVGSVAFWLFVWLPADEAAPTIEKRLRRLMLAGWALAGVSGILILLLHVSIAAQIPLPQAAADPALGSLLFSSRYGQVWLGRLALWLLMGGLLRLAGSRPRLYGLALLTGTLLLLTTSVYSHASATPQDTTAAVANDWLHLTASAFWIGGLIAFFVVLGAARQAALSASTLAGRFSNYARVAVFSLIISGFYAGWLHVGTIEGLLTTVYGQALLVKLLLVLPLLLIAAVNLFVTYRRLRSGQAVWTARLRGLVGAEAALMVGILMAVGMMTATAPARAVMAVRVAASSQPVIYPFFEMQVENDLMAHLEIVPGAVGENEFLVSLYDAEGRIVNDASLIRLRFDSLEQNLGQSELRPELRDDGIFYTATGSNLSVPGQWRIRMTVQRPQQFDTVLDFQPTISAAAPPPPVIESALPPGERGLAAALAGAGLLAMGGFFLARGSRPLRSSSVLSGVALLAGAALLATAAPSLMADTTLRVRDAWSRPMPAGMTGAVYLIIENNTPQQERLVGADTPAAARVELHQTVIENQIASMKFVPGLDIPAYSQLVIETGGYHFMLNDLRQDLIAGETFPLTLHFASGKFLTVEVMVQAN